MSGPKYAVTLAELDANKWASCGPAAFAALLKRPLSEVRTGFPRHAPGRTSTNLTGMLSALDRLEVKHRLTTADATAAIVVPGEQPMSWPTMGLVLVQFRGSWSQLPIYHPAQLQRTHWIAVAPEVVLAQRVTLVFDVNLVDDKDDDDVPELPVSHGWTLRQVWEMSAVPALASAHGRTATGTWYARAGIEVGDERGEP